MYGTIGHQLFAIPDDLTPSQFMSTLEPIELARIFEVAVLGRGHNYYYDGHVEGVDFHPGLIVAEVIGREVYEVHLQLQGQHIVGFCTCPYESRCKHLAAVLLYLIEEADADDLALLDEPPPAAEVAQDNPANALEEYLDGLSKAELKDLIRDLAPPSFVQAIQLRFADPKMQYRVLQQVEKNLQRLLDRELYDLTSFEQNLQAELEKLRGLWHTYPQEITELLLTLIAVIDESIEEGNLYDHQRDETYEGILASEYMAEFVSSLPFSEQRSILPKFWTAIAHSEYSTFGYFPLDVIDHTPPKRLRRLAKLILKQELLINRNDYMTRGIYDKIEPVLKKKEKKRILQELQRRNSSFLLKWVAWLEENGQVTKALSVLDKAIKQAMKRRQGHQFLVGENANALFQKRMELARQYQKGKGLKKMIDQYLSYSPTAAGLTFAVSALPKHTDRFETILRENNLAEYVSYLEQEKRFAEVVDLFEQYPEQLSLEYDQYPFYQRRKQLFPEQALSVFKEMLAENLAYAKKSHYYRVAEVLQQMRPLEAEATFTARVQAIASEYSRRTSLIRILRQYGVLA